MIKAVIVDDELPVLNLLELMIGKAQKDNMQIEIIGKFTNSAEALQQIPILKPALVFLDVSMPGMNGIELATGLIDQLDELDIVFVTGFEQYAIHAFQLNAVHYLLKPVTAKSIIEAVKRIEKKHGLTEQKFNVKQGELRLFGNMHLRVNNSEVKFLTAKVEELLALLLIHRENGISKWQLMDILWPETSMEKSQQNLYTMIYRLKKMLKESGLLTEIKTKNGIYTLKLHNVNCDVVDLDQFLEQKQTINEYTISNFQNMIDLYQGDLLGNKEYFWSINNREYYYQRYVELITAVAAYYIKQDEDQLLKKLIQQVKQYIIEEDLDDIRNLVVPN